MSKRYLISLIIALLVLNFLVSRETIAGTQHNVLGFAWSENVGWISFNSLNCDPDGDGFSNGETGCPPAGTPIPNYGVNVDLSTGNFSGYAWAGGGEDALGNNTSTIGWISFETSSLVDCPDGNCFARMDTTTGEVFGWARACSVFQSGCSGPTSTNTGGWDGWIKLRGFVDLNQNGTKDIDEPDYGVYLDTDNEFRGWAWGGNDTTSTAVIGWISFNCKDRDWCATSSYKVYLTNLPPSADNLSVDAHSSDIICGEALGSRAKFSWNFVDPGDSQSAYQIQISTSSDFFSIIFDTGKITSPSESFLLQRPYQPLEWGRHYYWRLKVWDSHDTPSDWILGPEFDTPSHSYPTVDFIWKPKRPTVGQVVEFTNNSQCYTFSGTTTCAFFFWTFEGGNPPFSDLENPTTTFSTIGGHRVSLRVRDQSNYECTSSETIFSIYPLPFWREIPPFLYLERFLASLVDVFKRIFSRSF